MTYLNEIVAVERRFALSARLDSDLNGTPPLTGYVLQASVEKAFDSLLAGIRDANQHAFTWTGPYGGGKSCAALLVASLVAGQPQQRKLARAIVGSPLAKQFDAVFSGREWRVLPVTGRRAPLRSDLALAAASRFGWSDAETDARARDDRALIGALEAEASDGGLLLIIDELGKFLEHAAETMSDVHLLQDLAERATRTGGKMVVIGILHQSFEHYAGRLSRTARDEWSKIQGRFQNIPFVAHSDEVVSLLGRAISASRVPATAAPLARRIAERVGQRRPVDQTVLASGLERAWPLHPVTALMLGPLSRQRFAQNERSVFGFLSSAEPFGFQSFLAHTAFSDHAWYSPDQLWDYLIANFGSALSVGPDGHRLTLAAEAIERALLLGALHGKIAKSAALIELFRNGSGLVASGDILALCAPEASRVDVVAALAALVDRAVLIEQPRLGGYALFAGSDFDLEAAVTKASAILDTSSLIDLPARLSLGPIPAKRLYFGTGALRTFDLALQPAEDVPDNPGEWAAHAARQLARRKRKTSGLLVLLVPDPRNCAAEPAAVASALSVALEREGLVAGVAVGAGVERVHDRALELLALDRIEATHPQLEGDRIARREIGARRAHLSETARAMIAEAFAAAHWWALGLRHPALDGCSLPVVASQIGADAFPQTPIIKSELLCRDKPSSNAVAALRALAHAMVAAAELPELGLTGFPAERGLYLTVLVPLGLHRPDANGRWRFRDPEGTEQAASFVPAWRALASARKMTIAELYDVWAARPFGIKRGVMPLLVLAYLLAHRASIALYIDGNFEAVLDDVFVDRLLQDPHAIELRRVARSKQDRAFVERLAARLQARDERIEAEALPIASLLYQRVHALPLWTQRTLAIGEQTRRVRDVVLKARDPEALLFEDLPKALKDATDPADAIAAALAELDAAYPAMLEALKGALADHLGVDCARFEGLGSRAVTAAGVTADLRLDAFAMRAGAFEGGEGDIEGLASLLVHKPSRSWTDREHEQALFELAKLARRFREAEAFASVKGRAPTAQAISIVIGLDPSQSPVFQTFEVTEHELALADKLAGELLARLRDSKTRSTVELAAIARLIERLSSEPIEKAA